MKETAKERMERHRKAWHAECNILDNILREFRALTKRWQAAREATAKAHQQYKDSKAVWRTGRECNITDADNAAMVHKLRQP
jgi:hypothetical protein